MPPSPADPIDATVLLNAAATGDEAAADRLLPLGYDQLRKAAQLKLAGEPNDRARARDRRGGRPMNLAEIGDVADLAEADPEKILAVDEAVRRLEADDPEAAAVVRLRFYAGLSVDEAAKALGTSPRTAARLWTYARAVLYRNLSGH